MAVKTIILTTTGASTWTVPGDWTDAGSVIRVIGGGGGGGRGTASTNGGAGGGGGGFAQVSAIGLVAGQVVNIFIGTGGTGATTTATAGTAGANTWINKAAATAPTLATNGALATGGGGGGISTTVGTAGVGSIGTTLFNGGAGGTGSASFGGGGGGGGAAGTQLAVGGTGGNGFSVAGDGGGGGGGGTYTAATTRNGTSATTTTGGAGGLSYTGGAGGTAGTGGTTGVAGGAGANGAGGGGGGASTTALTSAGGGIGGAGTEYTLTAGGTAGSGGAGGGGGGNNQASGVGGAGGAGANYGGGGGGGGSAVTTGNGGNGAQGAIIITYTSADTMYWVSGSGTWSGTAGGNWALTSGGAATTNWPTSTTAIIFDASSNQGGALTVTIGTGAVCASLDASTVDTAMTFSGTADATIGGSISLPSAVGLTVSGYSGTWNVIGTGTITPNAKTVPKLNINGTGITVTLGGAATVQTSVTLTAGTLSVSTFTLTTPLVSSNNANTRNLTFGSGGKIVLTGNATTIWDFATATGFTVTGTSLVESNYSGATGTRTFSHGSTAGGSETNDINLSITAGTDIISITAASHIGDLIFTGFGAGSWTNTGINIYGSLTISTGMTVGAGTNTVTFGSAAATQTITSNGKNLDFPITKSGAGTIALSGNLSNGTSTSRLFTFTSGTISLGTATLTIFGSFSSNNANTRSVNFGTGKIVISDTAAGTLWDTTTVTGWTTAGTPLVELTGGGAVTRTVSAGAMTEANSISFSFLNTAGTSQFVTGNTVRNLTLNGTFTFVTTSINLTIYGSYLASTAVTLTTTTSGTWTFASTSGTDTINSGGLSHAGIPVTFNGAGGTFQIVTNIFNIGSSALTLTAGTLDGNNVGFTCGSITANGGTLINPGTVTNAGALTLSAGSFSGAGSQTHASANQTGGTIDLTGGTSFVVAGLYTISLGTITLGAATLTAATFTNTGTTAKTINFGTGRIKVTSDTAATVFSIASATGYTITGAPLVEVAGTLNVARTISTLALTEAQAHSFIISSTLGTTAFTASNTVKDLTVTGGSTISNIAITIYGSYSASGSPVFTAGINAWTFGGTATLSRTIGASGITHDFPWTFNCAGVTYTQNGNIILGNTNGTLTMTAGTISPATFNITVNNLTVGGGTISTGIGTMTVNTATSYTSGSLAGDGVQVHNAVTINGTVTYDVTASSSWTASGLLTLTAGTLNLTNKTMTCRAFASSGTGVRALTYGTTGKIVLSSTLAETVWNTATLTSLTISGTGTVELTGAGATTKTISTGAMTEAQSHNFNILNTAGSVTFTASNIVRNLTVDPGVGAVTIANIAITIYGSYSATGSVTYTAGVNAWTFGGTTNTSRTMDPNGITHAFPWTFNCTGVTYTQSSNIVLGTNGTLTMTAGTLTPSGNDITVVNLTVGGGTISTGVGTMTVSTATSFTSGSLAADGTQSHAAVTINGTVSYDISGGVTYTASGLFTLTAGTLTLGTKTLTCRAFSSASATARTIAFGTGRIVLTSSITETTWNTSTITSLTLTGSREVQTTGGGAAAVKTISAGALGENSAFNFILNDTAGTVTFTAGNTVQNLTLNGTFTLSNVALTIYQDYSVAGSVTFTAGANAWTFSGTLNTTRTLSGTLTHDFPWTFNCSGVTYTQSTNIVLGNTNGTLTLTAGTLTPAGFNINCNNLTVQGGTLSTSIGTLTVNTLTTYTSGTLPANGNQVHNSVTINGVVTYDITTSTTWTASGLFTLTAGTLTLTNDTLTCRAFSSGGTGTRAINFGTTGKIVLTSTLTETIFTNTTTGLTLSGTQLIESTGGGATTKTINCVSNTISFNLYNTAGTVTFTAANAINDLTINGAFTLANIAISIFGNYTYATTLGTATLTAGVNAWTLAATSGTKTFNSAGVTHDFPITVNGSGGTFALGSDLLLGVTNGTLTVTAGTLSPSTHDITVTNLTVNGGTVGTGVGTMTVRTATSYTVGSLAGDGIQSHAAVTVNGTVTYDISSSTSYTASGLFTLTAGTLTLTNKTLTCRAFSSGGTGTRAINFGTTGKLVLTSTLTETIFTNTTTGLTLSGTQVVETNGGGATTKTINCVSNTISFRLLNTAGTVTFTAANVVDDLVINGTFTLANIAISIFGSYTYTAGTLTAGTNAWTFASTTSGQTISGAGTTHDFPITFNGVGGVWTLGSNFTVGATRVTTLTNGTLALSTFAWSTGQFTSNNANTRSITAGTGGKITCTFATAATLFDTTTITGLTTSGNPTVEYAGSAAIARTISVGALSEANAFSFLNSCTAGSIVFTATNTFYSVTLNGVGSTVSNIAITLYGNLSVSASQTLTAGANAWTLAGTGSNRTFDSSTSLTFPIIVNTATGTYTQDGNFTTGAAFTLTNGTVSVGAFTFTSTSTVTINGGTFTGVAASNVSITTMAYAGGSLVPFGTHAYTTFTQSGGSGNLDLANNTSFTVSDLYTHTSGTITFSGKTLATRRFNTSNANARTLAFGTSGTSKLQLTSALAETIFDCTTNTNLTVSGTSLVETTGGGATTKTIIASNISEANAISFSLKNTAGTVAFTASDAIKDLTLNGTFTLSNVAITIYGNYTYTAATLTAGTNAWTFAGSSGTDLINSAGVTHDFPLIFAGSAINQLTSNLVVATGKAITVSSGTLNPNNFNITTGDLNVSGGTVSTSIANLTVNGTTTYTSGTLNSNGTQVHNAFVHNGGSLDLTNTTSFTCTTTYNLTSGTLALGTKTLNTAVFNSNNTNVRTITFGSGGKFNITGNNTTVWDIAVTNNLTLTGTSRADFSYSGATGTRTIINASAAGSVGAGLFNFNVTAGTDTITFYAASGRPWFNNLDFTGFSGTWDVCFSTGASFRMTGSLTLSSTMTLLAANLGNVPMFSPLSATTATLTTNGKTFDFNVILQPSPSPGGTLTLADNFTMASSRTFTLDDSTLNINGKTFSVGAFSTNYSTTRVIAFGTNGVLTLTGSGTVFDATTATGLSTTGTNAVINFSSSSAKTFIGGGGTYGVTLRQTGTGDLSITGSNTFDNIVNTVQPVTIKFEGGSTNTFTSNFGLNGTAGNLVTLTSTNTTQFTLSKSSGTITVFYLNISYSIGAGGAEWNADEENYNVDSGGNSGWIFVAQYKGFSLFFIG